MTDRGYLLLSLPVVAVLLAVLVLALLILGNFWGLGLESLYLLAIPVVLAIAYLAWYRTLPYEPVWPAPAGTREVPAEPFEDPVEEADRLEQGDAGSRDTEDEEDGEGPSPPSSPDAAADDDDEPR